VTGATSRLVAGNWKMNGGADALGRFDDVLAGLPAAGPDVLVCPPATLVAAFAARAAGRPVSVGGQDCHPDAWGAHTGDLSAELLRDAGATACIVGHSERRSDHGETDELVAAKLSAAWRAGLLGILCVGEPEEVFCRGREAAQRFVYNQLRASLPDGVNSTNTVVAYEPIWAIGSGRSAAPDDIATMHAAIRKALTGLTGANGRFVRLLYGGSAKPANAREILSLPEVNGVLVGGASLRPEQFLAIVQAGA